MVKPGKKKGGKKSKDVEEESTPPPEEAEEEDFEFQKTVLEIRVKELETLKTGIITKCDYLENENEFLKVQLAETEEEKEDLVGHLERCLKEERASVKELEDRLYGLIEAKKDEALEYERRLKGKDLAYQEMEERMEKNIVELKAQLTSLQDFRMQKEKLTEERETLSSTLEAERTEFRNKFNELEEKHIKFKEDLKNDAVQIILKTAKLVQQTGKKSLTKSIQFAIENNVKLQEELEEISKNNISLRQRLQICTRDLRQKKMEVQILYEENSRMHQTCLKLENALQIQDKQEEKLKAQIENLKLVEQELQDLNAIHSQCKTVTEIEKMIDQAIQTYDPTRQESFHQLSKTAESICIENQDAYFALRDIVLKMALASKDLTEAKNSEESEYLKENFKTVLVRLYGIACDLPDLTPELKNKLVFNIPQVNPFFAIDWK